MRDDEDGSDTERHRRSDHGEESPGRREENLPRRSGRTSLSHSDTSRTEPELSGNRTVTDFARSLSGQSITVETESIAATLIGVPRVDVHEYVYDHQLDAEHEPDDTQTIAMFDLENTGSYPVTWRTSRTRFIGTDGYTYRPAQLSLDPSQLGPGCHTRQVEIEPGRRARVVTLVETLPGSVDVAEVVHKLTTYGDSQQLTFTVE